MHTPAFGSYLLQVRALTILRPLAAALSLACLVGACRTASIDPVSIQDAQTAAQVKTALVNDPQVGAMPIQVSVSGGIVRLTGTVGAQAHIDRARDLARAVQGVRDVELDLRIASPSSGASLSPGGAALQGEADEPQGDPRLLAVGVSFGWSNPRADGLASRFSVGPLFRLGSGRGLGVALALNWFQTTLAGASPDVVSRIKVRPLMAGLSYTFANERVSVSPSLVGGLAFNSLTVPETGIAGRFAVEVGNSLVWRPGVSVWIDVNRRAAVNLSAGYVMTGLRVTFLENGRLERHDVRGDTALLQAGVAYKLF